MPDLFLAVNAHGPEGELATVGSPVPAHWPDELVDSLVASGGAGDQDYVEGVIGRPVDQDQTPPAEEFEFENINPVPPEEG